MNWRERSRLGLNMSVAWKKRSKRKSEKRLKGRDHIWKDTGGLGQAKELFGGTSTVGTRFAGASVKKSLRLLSGFMTGHCTFKGHLKTWDQMMFSADSGG